MFNIETLNAIAEEGLESFNREKYRVDENVDPDGLLLRSYSLHDYEFPKSLKAIARAGAGVNNIPLDTCSEQGIVVFNTPGANANAVKELVLASLFMSARPIIEGSEWVRKIEGDDIATKVEAGKKAFSGTELLGKKLGIIGLGAIGALVANDAAAIGMEVSGFDPYVSVDTAWKISTDVKRADTLEEILTTCDYISVHVPLRDNTRQMFNPETLLLMQSNAVLLNFSRGELVDEEAMAEALDGGRLRLYVTDFASDRLLKTNHVRVLPHLGASTEEAEINCSIMAARELQSYLETGTIKNSVNYPNVEMPYNGHPRIGVCHRNVPNTVGQVTTLVANHDVNILDLTNRSRGDYAYTLLDLEQSELVNLEAIKRDLEALDGILRVRVIEPLGVTV
ncbi:D-isomer specific 2-hydroxyacid dehydrogenase [Listeria floridensis FSL S10-1187]|uniref:D-3-phosphoglycerate dehydrogenase n=1 Tax=Listeria floridensis FSL S10-1187 TaxID=1265817 RepID=A0ABN0RCD7_9LIST|nr:phosphoglycerate dehydrogenase [Listeria floridensis]EUJ26171.1 D-isomer specific 2-hydroxyacid dehydrogenase [Listeria floridensis FSL S10-1187]